MKIYIVSVILVFTVLMSSCSEGINTKSLQKTSYQEIPSREVADTGLINGMNFTVDKGKFVDVKGRMLFLRGINFAEAVRSLSPRISERM